MQSPAQRSGEQPSPVDLPLLTLMAVALSAGGGGVGYGLANLAVQLTALIILACQRGPIASFWRDVPRSFGILFALTIALPILQLVPLPPIIWEALPGRELAVETRQAVGASGWYPITLDSGRTLVAAIGLIAPFTVLTLARASSVKALARIGWVIVAAGCVNFLIGVPQVLTGSALIYPEIPMDGVMFGLFANRNSAGIMFVASAVLAATLPSGIERRQLTLLRFALLTVFCLGTILTQSRSAILLGALLAMGWAAMALLRGRSIRMFFLTVAFIGGMIALVAMAAPHTRLSDISARFTQTEDARSRIWPDALYSAGKYWPTGSGMGTFDEVFQADESLENLSPRAAGRAHNDYLEIAIEAGPAGLAIVLGWIILALNFAWRQRYEADRWRPIAALAILGTISAQSLVDYTLRSQAMLCLAAFSFALLLRQGERPKQ